MSQSFYSIAARFSNCPASEKLSIFSLLEGGVGFSWVGIRMFMRSRISRTCYFGNYREWPE